MLFIEILTGLFLFLLFLFAACKVVQAIQLANKGLLDCFWQDYVSLTLEYKGRDELRPITVPVGEILDLIKSWDNKSEPNLVCVRLMGVSHAILTPGHFEEYGTKPNKHRHWKCADYHTYVYKRKNRIIWHTGC